MKNILRAWTAVFAVVLTLTAITSLADEQAATTAKHDKTYEGTIVSVNPSDRTLDVKGWLLTKQFNLGGSCAFVMLDKPLGAIGDLRPGEKITVSYQNASGVLAADRVEQKAMTREGTVKAIDPASHKLTLRANGTDREFQIPDDCKIVLRDNHSGSLANVQIGDRVTVTYETPGDKNVAREIVQGSETFTGEVTAIDLNDRTVKAKAMFGAKQFNLGDNCAIVINGKMGGELNALKLGDRLEFNYNDVNGVNVANRIATAPQPLETTSAQPLYP